MKKNITIIIADDKLLIQNSLKSFLSAQEAFEVVGTATTGRALLDLLKTREANILIIDPTISDVDGWEVMSIIKERYPMIKVIVLTNIQNKTTVKEAIFLGARSYHQLNLDPIELCKVIIHLQTEKFYFTKEILEIITDDYICNTVSSHSKAMLNARENQILNLLIDGNSAKQIAEKLKISTHAIKYHQKNIYKKTNSHSLTEAIKNSQSF